MKASTAVQVILGAAFISFLLSVALWFGFIPADNAHDAGLYVGLWVPSILALGVLLAPRGRA